MLKKSMALLWAVLLLLTATAQAKFSDNYQLEEMVILSRHNIRSPLAKNGSVVGMITPHEWFKWTSAPSELSLRGGQLETMLGQYFRLWLVDEGLITDNYLPKEGEVRFYANSRQRTIATAQYFSSGMLPVANVKIEHKFDEYDKVDPVFKPQFTYMNDALRAKAMQEISAMGGSKGLQGINDKLRKEYALLERVLDLKDSELAKKEGFDHFRNDDLEITLEADKEPTMKNGSLKYGYSASDALILQYYEEPDVLKAGFGNKLTTADWERFAKVKDAYDAALFTAPSVAVNIAHPLLEVLNEELSLNGRKFAFLCGHDSNIASVLAALNVEKYSLPNSIEKHTPIGGKIVITKWKGKDGAEYAALDYVYQSTEQLRDRTALTLENPPMIYRLKLRGLTQNKDGLYKLSDVQQRFKDAIDAYGEFLGDEQRIAA